MTSPATSQTHHAPKNHRVRAMFDVRSAFMELFDIGPVVALTVLAVMTVILVAGIIFFIQSAPPTHLTIISGPEGSSFYKTALKYQKALAKNGVKLKILTSEGSIENLDRISYKESPIDLALIQSGIAENDANPPEHVVSLGAVGNMPLFFFYRGSAMEHLHQITGKTVAVGSEGSGTRKIALKLLELNGIKDSEPGTTKLLAMDADDAANALFAKKIDAAFIMSENIATEDLRKLMRSEDVHLMNFDKNAAAYVRKVGYLNMLALPEGAIDFAKDIPETDIVLVGPTIELIASSSLHPALSDLVLDAAMTIHSRPGLFQKRGEFPAEVEQDIPRSEDADRFFKTGKTLFYRHLPFWLASLINRIVVVIIPMVLVLIPVMRIVPWMFRWRHTMRMRRFYRALMEIESEFKHERHPEKIAHLKKNFARIDIMTHNMRVRPAFADTLYNLRGHVDYVRRTMDHQDSLK